MLQRQELMTLARDLARTKVLTAYVDRRATDPSARRAWRSTLTSALSAARRAIFDADERDAFDRASRVLAGALATTPQATSQALFVTADRVVHDAFLPSNSDTIVLWREGPAIAPYLRMLEQHHIAIVASVHARAIQLYRHGGGVLETIGAFSAPDRQSADGRRTARQRSRAVPAARSATTTDIARRRERSVFRRLADVASARLAAIADEHSLILIAGEASWTRHFTQALPAALAERAAIHDTVLVGQLDVARAARRALSTHFRVRERELATRTIAAMGGTSVLGSNAVFDALEFRAVDQLIVSARAIRARWNDVEDLISAAIAQGARVAALSGEGAAALDRACGGIAARTRFTFDSAMPRRPFRNVPTRERVATLA